MVTAQKVSCHTTRSPTLTAIAALGICSFAMSATRSARAASIAVV